MDSHDDDGDDDGDDDDDDEEEMGFFGEWQPWLLLSSSRLI